MGNMKLIVQYAVQKLILSFLPCIYNIFVTMCTTKKHVKQTTNTVQDFPIKTSRLQSWSNTPLDAYFKLRLDDWEKTLMDILGKFLWIVKITHFKKHLKSFYWLLTSICIFCFIFQFFFRYLILLFPRQIEKIIHLLTWM